MFSLQRHAMAIPSLEGVVGACKRGRHKGRRNKTSAERASAAIMGLKRVEKNTREKVRIKNVNHGYELLQRAIGQDRMGKNPTKLKTLEVAIKYIHDLLDELQTETAQMPPYANLEPLGDEKIYPVALTEPSVSKTGRCIHGVMLHFLQLKISCRHHAIIRPCFKAFTVNCLSNRLHKCNANT